MFPSSSSLRPMLSQYRYHKAVVWAKQILAQCKPKSLTPRLPTSITIDISSVCNLRCPFCPTGSRTIRLPQGYLSADDFRTHISQFPHLSSAVLCNWGEPLLNPELFQILAITRQKHIETELDTNFSLSLSDAFLLNLLQSGLGILRVSLDGASQQTYATYRKSGDFAVVFSNMERLRVLQKRKGITTPVIFWKFIVHRHNEHEMEKAVHMAKDIDVTLLFDALQLSEDIVDVRVSHEPLTTRKEFWLTTKSRYASPYYKKSAHTNPYVDRPCPWLFSSLVIHTDGSVLPCCYTASGESAMGNIRQQPITDIWHSPAYQYARSLFLPHKKMQRTPVVCEHCRIYARKSISA